MKKTILIAGGSGLIGTFLQKRFQELGCSVRILSRSVDLSQKGIFYHWDPKKREFDQAALEHVDVVINLAGASIADRRWTDSRKKVMWESRITTSEFLLEQIKLSSGKIDCYIGASASGIYGDRGDEILTEESKVGKPGFLVDLSSAWEDAHRSFKEVAKRVKCIRIGVVLSNQGGAFPKLRNAVLGGVGGYLSTGKQYLPWIHIDDLIRVFEWAVNETNQYTIINGVAPNPQTNYQFMYTLSKLRWGFGWLFPVPGFILRLLLGEMSQVLLDSQRVIPEQLLQGQFTFDYAHLKGALENLLGEKE